MAGDTSVGVRVVKVSCNILSIHCNSCTASTQKIYVNNVVCEASLKVVAVCAQVLSFVRYSFNHVVD